MSLTGIFSGTSPRLLVLFPWQVAFLAWVCFLVDLAVVPLALEALVASASVLGEMV